ncbi:MAG: hypothetical protein P8L78_05880 [Mariniblastus sp.]|jgi:hypothetical protein|nr:hypothetical protein [Mariniblastus sp.]MDG2181202.1 hypothetical protein [Mariniblastus sp.]
MTSTKAIGMRYDAGKWLLNVGVVLWFVGVGLVLYQKFLWFSVFAVTGLLLCYFGYVLRKPVDENPSG